MTANNNDRRPANVDEAGIRLAPQPLDAGSAKQLPSVRQEFVIAPSLDYPDAHRETDMPSSTARDYQPEEKDVNKKWKRSARNKNMVAGVVMLIASAAAIVPFLLAFFSVNGDSLPFKYIPEQFNVIRHWVDAFSRTVALGWKGDEVNTIWLYMVPDIIVSVGIIGIVANLVQSVFGKIPFRRGFVRACGDSRFRYRAGRRGRYRGRTYRPRAGFRRKLENLRIRDAVLYSGVEPRMRHGFGGNRAAKNRIYPLTD